MSISWSLKRIVLLLGTAATSIALTFMVIRMEATSKVDISKWYSRPVIPVFAMSAHVPLSSRDRFFDALKKYSEENGFSFEVSWVLQSEDTMDVMMRRRDGILRAGNGFDREEFDIDLIDDENAPIPADVGEALKAKLLEGLKAVPKLSVKDRDVGQAEQ